MSNLKQGNSFLVTGGAGFIGSNICDVLIRMGNKVICLDNLTTGKISNIENLLSNSAFTFVKADIRDFETCFEACKKADYVLHQAAMGSVPRSMLEPLLYEDVNIKGTMNMLEAARKAGVSRFVFASSSSVYGNSEKLPKVEGSEGLPLSPYALTKKVCEEIASLYSRVYSMQTIGLRYFNVYGKRQDPESQYAAVIPRFIKKILNQQPIEIFGDGKQTRDFTYIDDVVQANIKACMASEEAAGQVYNIANGEGTSLLALAEIIEELLGRSIERRFLKKREGDIMHSKADISKSMEYLGFIPEYPLRKGISETIKWYM